jgi:myo-inositol-1(or 4)-monophosphatase
MRELDIAIAAAREGGKILLDHFRHPHDVKHKTSFRDIVTEADAEADEAIRKFLQRKTPDIGIQTEESGGSQTERFWCVDPLDGTMHYYYGLDSFSTCLCLVEKGVVTVGVVYCPVQDELFAAVKGQGAFRGRERITASKRGDVKEALIATRHTDIRGGSITRLTDGCRALRVAGSTAQDLCYLAAGWIDLLAKSGQSLWDYGAGKLILEEAGGKLTGWDGKAPDFKQKQDILASNGLLHEKAVGLLKK